MRRVIARRLTESKQQVPHFYLTIDCEIDAAAEAARRSERQGAGEGRGRLQALGQRFRHPRRRRWRLRKVPAANASWREEAIVLFDAVDISVAVAIPDGLITPIIRNADQKGLAAISTEMKDSRRRAPAPAS